MQKSQCPSSYSHRLPIIVRSEQRFPFIGFAIFGVESFLSDRLVFLNYILLALQVWLLRPPFFIQQSLGPGEPSCPFHLVNSSASTPYICYVFLCRTMFQLIFASPVISAIFLTLFARKNFHDFPGLIIQYRATKLSIHTVVDTIGHLPSALCRFRTKFAGICLLTNSNLAIDVFRFEILDLDVSKPLTTPVVPSMTAMATAEHAVLLASAKT